MGFICIPLSGNDTLTTKELYAFNGKVEEACTNKSKIKKKKRIKKRTRKRLLKRSR